MIAHLYRIPSTCSNAPDKIIISATERSSYPGTWRHAAFPLPDGWKALDTDFGEGFLLTDSGEAITEVYPTSRLTISGSVYTGFVTVYGGDGRELIRKRLQWS